ncbi:MAG: septum formation initiator family protein [Geminicoccaceae bacterium]
MWRNLREWVTGQLKGRWLGLGVTLVLAYFGYHAVHGSYGLLAWIDTSRDLAAAREQLASLSEEREQLESNVAAFQPDSLDRDRLEEQLRLLGYVRPNEVLILRRDEAAGE